MTGDSFLECAEKKIQFGFRLDLNAIKQLYSVMRIFK